MFGMKQLKKDLKSINIMFLDIRNLLLEYDRELHLMREKIKDLTIIVESRFERFENFYKEGN